MDTRCTASPCSCSLATMVRARCVFPVPGRPVSSRELPARQFFFGGARFNLVCGRGQIGLRGSKWFVAVQIGWCEGSDWFVRVRIGLWGFRLVCRVLWQVLPQNRSRQIHSMQPTFRTCKRSIFLRAPTNPRRAWAWLETSLARRIKAPHLRTAEALQTHMHPRRDSKHKKTAH